MLGWGPGMLSSMGDSAMLPGWGRSGRQREGRWWPASNGNSCCLGQIRELGQLVNELISSLGDQETALEGQG